MPVRIIKRGNPPKEKVYDFTCGNCKSELQAKKADASGGHTHRNERILGFKCPVCDHLQWVDE